MDGINKENLFLTALGGWEIQHQRWQIWLLPYRASPAGSPVSTQEGTNNPILGPPHPQESPAKSNHLQGL